MQQQHFAPLLQWFSAVCGYAAATVSYPLLQLHARSAEMNEPKIMPTHNGDGVLHVVRVDDCVRGLGIIGVFKISHQNCVRVLAGVILEAGIVQNQFSE